MNCGRKRTQSISSSTVSRNKKKKLFTRNIVPPTKFLLGGNIRDPLNLCGLPESPQHEPEDNTAQHNERSFGPYPEFLLGGDINDPLNLKNVAEEQDVAELQDTEAACRNNNNEAQDEAKITLSELEVAPSGLTEDKQQIQNHHLAALKKKDKIVSPVIPQPCVPLKNVRFKPKITPSYAFGQRTPRFKEKDSKFKYGNYNRYYGYRNANHGLDLRLEILSNYKHYFANRDVLDIGCNIGHIAMIIARDFGANSVTGIDIDRSLIEVAKKNVKHYINCTSPYSRDATPHQSTVERKKLDLKNKCYPVSMPILYGSVSDDNFSERNQFPKNISFTHGNYVLESDFLLDMEKQQFDTILCLSTTKWIHLNFGDDGLKRTFKRMFRQLRPGGILILEPQSWDSYTKKKNLTELIWNNYKQIQLFPHHFDQYLLSSEIGFSRSETLALVNHPQKGFRRPLKVFFKSVTTDVGPSSQCQISQKQESCETSENIIAENKEKSRELDSTIAHGIEKSGEILSSAESRAKSSAVLLEDVIAQNRKNSGDISECAIAQNRKKSGEMPEGVNAQKKEESCEILLQSVTSQNKEKSDEILSECAIDQKEERSCELSVEGTITQNSEKLSELSEGKNCSK